MQAKNKLEQIFNYRSHQIRTMMVDDEPWFVAADVCGILGLARQQDATRHLDTSDKRGCLINTPLGRQTMITVNEPGLYCLILRSRKPEAKDFTRWITHEVLPALRRTGFYQMPSVAAVATVAAHSGQLVQFSRRDLLNLAIEAQNEFEELWQENKGLLDENDELRPKAEFFDRVADSSDSFSLGETAKMLKVEGYGRNNLILFLRSQGILMRGNVAKQRYVDRGYFRVIQSEFNAPDGTPRVRAVTRVYEKGVNFIRSRLERRI